MGGAVPVIPPYILMAWCFNYVLGQLHVGVWMTAEPLFGRRQLPAFSFFATVHTGSGAQPVPWSVDTPGSFVLGYRSGRQADTSRPSSAKANASR
jgi:hypothetical protein